MIGFGALMAAGACMLEPSDHVVRHSSIILKNTGTTGGLPLGPFVSVLDSINVAVTASDGAVLSSGGYKLRGYELGADVDVEVGSGAASYVVTVLSRNKLPVFSGTAPVGSDTVVVPITAARPALVAMPDTSRTTILTTTQFVIYNAGSTTLAWGVGAIDTALTRCATACGFLPKAGSLAAGATAPLVVTLPANFPSRRLSFELQSNEGPVTVVWQYGASPIVGVTVQPPTVLLPLNDTLRLSAVVQTSGTANTAVNWSASSGGVASVSTTGLATGLTRGLTTIAATSFIDPLKGDTAEVRVYDSTAFLANWTVIGPAAARFINRDGAAPNDTASIIARASGPTGTFANPFSLVEFWARPLVGGVWLRIGQSAAPVLTDNGITRSWTWTIIWNPTPADAPFANQSTTQMAIMALGVGPAQTIKTPINNQVRVVVP